MFAISSGFGSRLPGLAKAEPPLLWYLLSTSVVPALPVALRLEAPAVNGDTSRYSSSSSGSSPACVPNNCVAEDMLSVSIYIA